MYRINENPGLFHRAQTLFHRNATVNVNAVSEKNDGSAAGHQIEPFSEHEIEGVIKARAAAGSGAANRAVNGVAVAGDWRQIAESAIERDHRDLVVRPKLINEGYGGVFDLLQARFRRIAHVQHQRDCYRLFG